MGDGSLARLLASILIIVASAFFVAAEYSLVGCRKSKMEALARRGNKMARRVVAALNDMNRHIAGVQICITLCGIGAGSVAEPYVAGLLNTALGVEVGHSIWMTALSLLVVTFLMVVIGELVPKYVVLQRTDHLALVVVPPLSVLVAALTPLIWVIDRSGAGILRLFGIRIDEKRSEAIPKEEMLLLLKAQSAEGVLEDVHAKMLARALQLDKLDAKDVMVHRMDIRWLDISLGLEELIDGLSLVPNTRIPVCRGDVDDVAGVLYIHDFVRHLKDKPFVLESILRPVVVVPENLTLDRIVERMQASHTQIVIVVDEYGGTAGLVTLEDVVEEIFGEIEDRMEFDRPPIEGHAGGRLSARSEVRYDELIEWLGIELPDAPPTDTLAQIMSERLGRVPRLGDTADLAIGVMRVENMARRRITRVSIQLSAETRGAVHRLELFDGS
ncbi:MAG: HlyC/CorC family transporter [Armatimonadetes bacterium]|nr:HlyC/CorC family transporter [Armatimonadota bacterium]